VDVAWETWGAFVACENIRARRGPVAVAIVRSGGLQVSATVKLGLPRSMAVRLALPGRVPGRATGIPIRLDSGRRDQQL